MGTARKENGIWLVRESTNVNQYDFEGTAYQVKANIDLIVEKAKTLGMVGDGWFDFNIVDNRYDSYIEVEYFFDRLENEKERTKREEAEAMMKAEAKAKRAKAAAKRKLKADAEFAEYERLKAKFKDM